MPLGTESLQPQKLTDVILAYLKFNFNDHDKSSILWAHRKICLYYYIYHTNIKTYIIASMIIDLQIEMRLNSFLRDQSNKTQWAISANNCLISVMFIWFLPWKVVSIIVKGLPSSQRTSRIIRV